MAPARPDISLVVVCHEMARELPRTIRSLGRGHQRGLDDCDYEIVVVDNGSAVPPRREDLPDPGVPLTVLTTPAAPPSPVAAMNRGLAAARGHLVGAWIDGARLASPGLVAACRAAAGLAARPVVATANYQLGPARQAVSVRDGYDRAAEDALLDRIGWPADGYRLFEIATPEFADPAGPIRETNALFMPADLWRELGGFDPAFTSPGGGFVNPDTLLRAVALADAHLVRVLGEGTFHQIHGGLTTADLARAIAVAQDGAREYAAIRGRPCRLVTDPGLLYRSPFAPAASA